MVIQVTIITVMHVDQLMEIEADLTTNHKGWMEVKLCVNDDPNKIITQECLDE